MYMPEDITAHYLLFFLIGIIFGALAFFCYRFLALRGIKQLSQEILDRAECDAEEIKKKAELHLKHKQIEHQKELEELWQQERKKIGREEERLKIREDKLEARLNLIEKKLIDTEKREAVLAARKEQVDAQLKEVSEKHACLIKELENVSAISATEAKELLLHKITAETKTEAAHMIRRIQKEAEEESHKLAASIITTAINRLAVPCTSEVTICTVTIPSEEIKGRIIGREGRNIRTLESATGVNFIIDETPGAVVLSGFDPIRKQIAKMALTELVQDGRIHQTRIEEVVEKATNNLQKQIKQWGEDAALRCGLVDLHPELIILLGKLKLRYSYGQNVLDHSLEVAHLMGLMAAEIHLDVSLAKRIGLLHDIGKALTHEVEGSHALLGQEVALRHGESKEVANGIGAHHGEIPPLTTEGDLCSAADSISASREGARVEAIQEYIKRLKALEEIAMNHEGVEKAYAMQAGREVRVIVIPDKVDDAGVTALAQDISRQIENELRYSGKIKVTVIREKRVIGYAV